MKDKTLLNIITILGMGGWALLFRKGRIKDWFLVYLFKALISTLLDSPVTKKKYVTYPKRYFPNSFDSNIVFIYVIFPLSCVIYNQFTSRMKGMKAILSVFIFSVPMALIENFLEKNTRLVKYGKGWNGFYTFSALSVSFWIVRSFLNGINYLSKKKITFEIADNTKEVRRKTNEESNDIELILQ